MSSDCHECKMWSHECKDCKIRRLESEVAYFKALSHGDWLAASELRKKINL